MVTKGALPVNISKEAAYDALLAACKGMGAKVNYADRESFVIDGESDTMWLQNRFSSRFYARVRAQYDGALPEVYDFSPKREDKRFLGKLFEKMKKRASVGEPDYKDVDSIEPESNQGPRPAYLQARPMRPQPARAAPPLLMVEGGRIKGQEYRVKIEGAARKQSPT